MRKIETPNPIPVLILTVALSVTGVAAVHLAKGGRLPFMRPAGVPTEHEVVSTLRTALDRDDPCLLLRELDFDIALSVVPPQRLFTLYFDHERRIEKKDDLTDSFQYILRALSSRRRLHGIGLLQSRDFKNGHFYRALLMGDLVDGPSSSEPATRKELYGAAGILAELASHYPKNGIYLFFGAALLEKLGAPREDLRRMMLEMVRSKQFKSNSMKLARRIGDSGFSSTTRYVLATFLRDLVPSPDFDAPADLLVRFVEEEPGKFAGPALAMSEEIIRFNSHYLASVLMPVAGVRRELTAAHRIYEAAWKKLRPEQPVPAEMDPARILSIAADQDALLRQAFRDAIRGGECWRQQLDELAGNQREAFYAYHSKLAGRLPANDSESN